MASLKIKTNVKSKYCKMKRFSGDLLRRKFHLTCYVSVYSNFIPLLLKYISGKIYLRKNTTTSRLSVS